MKKTLDCALIFIAVFIVAMLGVLLAKDFIDSDSEADACEAKGQVFIDSSSGRYCFAPPSGVRGSK